jgi:uncharacterized RDD family membrane protein YckC
VNQHPDPPVAYGYGDDWGSLVPAGLYPDQRSGLWLPKGTTPASPGRRMGAYLLAFPLLIITLGVGYVIWGLIIWGDGQTPALQVLGMRCYRPANNRVANFWWMALREIFGFVAEGTMYLIALISLIFMLSRTDHKTLRDMLAGTVVLHDPSRVLTKRH